MTVKTINPKNKQTLKEYPYHTTGEIENIISLSYRSFKQWKQKSFKERSVFFEILKQILLNRKKEIGTLITNEMGKPIAESIAEVEKCAIACDFYLTHGEQFLKDELISSDASHSYITKEPLGIIFAIMPWNFPLWQVFRFAIPALLSGNVAILKHASNVTGCSYCILNLFQEAGFPEGVFNIVVIENDKSEIIISDPQVKAVTLTGSEAAGSAVASLAGKYIKKTVLELGGSDPFIVLKDADLDFAVENAVKSRFLNTGQSCIAAKRFIIEDGVYDQFVTLVKSRIAELRVGDPLDETTEIGPIAREDLREQILSSITGSVREGAKLVIGGEKTQSEGFYMTPTLLVDVSPEMECFREEVFGPVLSVSKFSSINEAIAISNQSKYGLGASVWTQDINVAVKISKEIESGQVFINGIVKSDPRLPFGGLKNSGYGRELSEYGIKEFLNIKTVWIK